MVLTDPPLAARDTPRICTRYPEADCTRYPEPAPNLLRGYPHIWCRAWLVARTPPAVRSPPMGEVLQLELFRVTAAEPPWRDNRDAMEYPFLSLQKKRVKPIRYAKDDVSVSVYAPAEFGLASIWDWDLVIFAASHLNDCLESGLKPAPRIAFVPYDCLRQLCRHTGGKDYRELADAIRRLNMTTVITNLRAGDGGERPFRWLTDYWIPKKYDRGCLTPADHDGEPDPLRHWEIELPPWLYQAILRRRDILAVHPDYFRLTGGLERWLYRLARKAVPEKAEPPVISFRMATLHRQSGTTRPQRNFAVDIRKIAERQPLPEYGVSTVRDGRHELVTLYRDPSKPRRPRRGFKPLLLPGGRSRPYSPAADIPKPPRA